MPAVSVGLSFETISNRGIGNRMILSSVLAMDGYHRQNVSLPPSKVMNASFGFGQYPNILFRGFHHLL